MKVPTSPIPVAPPVTGPTPSTAEGDPAAAALFSALVAAVLGGAATAAEPPAAAVAGDLAASDESGLPASPSAGTEVEALLPETLAALLLAMSVPPTAAPLPATTGAPAGTGSADTAGGTDGTGGTDGDLLPGDAPSAVPAAVAAAQTGGAAGLPDQAAVAASGLPATAGRPVAPKAAATSVIPGAAATSAAPGAAATSAAPGTTAIPVAQELPVTPVTPGDPQLPAAHTAAPTTAGSPATPFDEAAPHPAPTTAAVAAGAGVESTASAPAVGQPPLVQSAMAVAPAAAADVPGPGPAVVRQIVPEVTRLISNGVGVHRVTLQLNPEALGEVRVVLTVRDGSVHVRLAAGNAAQQALLEGTPELRRLLEQTGAGETRIVVRDLPSGGASGNTLASASTGPGGDGSSRHASGQAGTAGQGSHDSHAGTRAGGPARDGTDDGAIPPRLVDQVAHARSAGVDVTV